MGTLAFAGSRAHVPSPSFFGRLGRGFCRQDSGLGIGKIRDLGWTGSRAYNADGNVEQLVQFSCNEGEVDAQASPTNERDRARNDRAVAL